MDELIKNIIVVIAFLGPMFIGAHVGQKTYDSVSESSGKFFGVASALFILGVVTFGIYFLLGLFGLASFLDKLKL